MKGSKKGESSYNTINGKAVLRIIEQTNQYKSFRSVGLRLNFECLDVIRNDRDQ
jgi:hypothetical protein